MVNRDQMTRQLKFLRDTLYTISGRLLITLYLEKMKFIMTTTLPACHLFTRTFSGIECQKRNRGNPVLAEMEIHCYTHYRNEITTEQQKNEETFHPDNEVKVNYNALQ